MIEPSTLLAIFIAALGATVGGSQHRIIRLHSLLNFAP
jgi:hypothetical protein